MTHAEDNTVLYCIIMTCVSPRNRSLKGCQAVRTLSAAQPGAAKALARSPQGLRSTPQRLSGGSNPVGGHSCKPHR